MPRDNIVFGNVAEAVLNWLSGRDPKWGELAIDELVNRVPTGGGLLRGGVETFIANYDYFRQRPLANQYTLEKPTELQFDDYTSTLSKILSNHGGKFLGVSPIEMDHLLSSASGGVYSDMTDIWDDALAGRLGPEHLPLFSGFFMNRHQAAPVNDFYTHVRDVGWQKQRDEAKGEMNGKAAQELAQLGRYHDLISEIRKLEPRKGSRRSFEYQKYLVGLALSALGRERQESNPDPFYADTVSPEVRKLLSDFAALRAEKAVLSYGRPEKVHKGDESYEETLSKWEAGRDADEAWLRKYGDSPIVEEAVSGALRSKRGRSISSGGLPAKTPAERAANQQVRKRLFSWRKKP
jgi:hypothetical protein